MLTTVLISSGVSVIDPMTFDSLDSIKKFVTDKLREIFQNNFPFGEIFDPEKIIVEIPSNIGNTVCFHFCQSMVKKNDGPPFMIADVTVHGETTVGWMKYVE